MNIMCLSFRTPPVVRPQAILIGKMIPEWVKQGINPIIVTYETSDQWQIDLPIYYIPQLKISRYFNKIGFVKNLIEKRYYQKIFKLVKSLIIKHKIELVFSFSNPYASNILGARLKEKLGVKFISHFSDPWYDDPYQSFSKSEKKDIAKKEKNIIQNSDRVIFNNEAAKDLVIKKYPVEWRKKSIVIPHCFDGKKYPALLEKKKAYFIISHIGAFYQQRNPDLLFSALSSVLAKEPNLKKILKLRLVGGDLKYTNYQTKDLLSVVSKFGLTEIAEILPAVSYQESLKEMKLADCLVVIDADFNPSPFFPSKVVDYAGSKTPIIGITPNNSPTAQFLNGLGCPSFDYQRENDLTDYLIKLINRQIKININENYLENFSVESTTKLLIKTFKEVLTKNL
ncbi:MAG TPA: glycosyltransferase [Patescibacteria group bacterium]|nr:glycosyltransferase [Patescibacteria group bacterium]